MRILYFQLLANSCADSDCPVARGNLCGYLGCPVAWCTEFRFEGRGQLCSQASSVTYLIGKVWTSWYGHKKEERPYGYLVSSSMLGTLSPFARSRPWFRLSSVGAQGAGTHSLGSGTPCSLLQPRRIHGWAIDWGTCWVLILPGGISPMNSGGLYPPWRGQAEWFWIVTWLILPVVICLSQRLSHACLSVNNSYETANGSLNQLSNT